MNSESPGFSVFLKKLKILALGLEGFVGFGVPLGKLLALRVVCFFGVLDRRVFVDATIVVVTDRAADAVKKRKITSIKVTRPY